MRVNASGHKGMGNIVQDSEDRLQARVRLAFTSVHNREWPMSVGENCKLLLGVWPHRPRRQAHRHHGSGGPPAE